MFEYIHFLNISIKITITIKSKIPIKDSTKLTTFAVSFLNLYRLILDKNNYY